MTNNFFYYLFKYSNVLLVSLVIISPITYGTCENVQGIILAAGKSTRFNTGKTKLVEKICGLEMVAYPVQLLKHMEIPTILVVGYQKESIIETVKKYAPEATFITQENQCGTGHAIICAQDVWEKEHILILNGDVPLITDTMIQNLYDEHVNNNAAISFVTSLIRDTKNCPYGRVIEKNGSIEIIEAKDFIGDIADYCFINAGIYIIKQDFLREHIAHLDQNNASKEFYITDLVKIASDNKCTVTTVDVPFDIIRGVNTLKELSEVEEIKKAELVNHWMSQGVYFTAPHNVFIDLTVTIGAGTKIGSGVHLLGDTHIGKNCIIKPFSIIENSIIADNVTLHSHSRLHNTHIEHSSQEATI